MKTALAIRHVHFEDLGIFEDGLKEAGYGIRYMEAGIDPVAGEKPDLLIVLGAPIGAYEEDKYPFLKDTLNLLEQRLAAQSPTLGICLGAQLMARAAGAKVYPGPAKEIGWSKLTLSAAGEKSPLQHLNGIPVLHWHGDTFDLPNEAVHLASTPLTRNQAFSLGKHALALQFHPEVKAEKIEHWLIGHACEIASQPGLSVTALREETKRLAHATCAEAKKLLADWLSRM